MKIAVREYTVRLTNLSTVSGVANDIDIYLKKIIFGESCVTVGEVANVVDVDPLQEALRIQRTLDPVLFEKYFGELSEDHIEFVKKFTYKATKPAKKDSEEGSEVNGK